MGIELPNGRGLCESCEVYKEPKEFHNVEYYGTEDISVATEYYHRLRITFEYRDINGKLLWREDVFYEVKAPFDNDPGEGNPPIKDSVSAIRAAFDAFDIEAAIAAQKLLRSGYSG